MNGHVDNPAFVLKKINELGFTNRGEQELGPKEVKVAVKQTGICGSDVHYWKKGRIGKYIFNDQNDMVLGHELSGVVVDIGKEVKDLKAGDRVALEPGEPCRYCKSCRAGDYNVCEDMKFAATPPWDGTLMRHYVTSYDFCYKIPDSMSMEEAALTEPLSVGVQICKRAQIRGGDNVVVFGCGPIGLMCQAVAKAYGCAKVIGVDVAQNRLDFAREFAADGVYMMPSKEEKETLEEFSLRVSGDIKREFGFGPDDVDVVLEATGAEPCIQVGVFLAKKSGTFTQGGMGKEFVQFPSVEALVKELNWKGCIRYTVGCYPAAIQLITSKKVDVTKLVTHRFDFEDAEKAFELVASRSPDVIKVMIGGVRD